MEIMTLKTPARKPYIYKVTNLETGQYYIGSQCSGKTIGVNYFTSSTNKNFLDDFKNYREEKYKIEIIKEFDDPKKCGRVENYIIRNYMLKKDGLCLNRACCCCNGEKIFSTVGTHLSEGAKQKISETHKGRPSPKKGTHLSEETKQKLSEANKGRPSWNKGHHHTVETRKRIGEAQKIKISIEGEVFNSIVEAAKYYNVTFETIRNWVKKNQHNAKKA